MNKQTSKPLEKLAVDVLDYMFVEWLIRRNLYSKFIANLARFSSVERNPRLYIRDHIRLTLDRPIYSIPGLMLGFFPFVYAPEGFRFWDKQSDEWRAYVKSFLKIF